MTFNTSNPNELAELCLVACDMSYKGRAAEVGEPLAPYFDPVIIGPEYDVVASGFTVLQSFQDDTTGLKAVVFRNLVTKELIVSFAGTDGQDPKDWWSAVTNLGWQQWINNRADIFGLIAPLVSDGYKFNFTGQSLGGALAQYAAYDFLNTVLEQSDRSRVTLTTFNALGGLSGLEQNAPGFVRTTSPEVFDGIAQGRHYVVSNDLVSQLGGGFVGGDTYELRFRNLSRIAPNGLPYEFGIVESHRIETGLYPNLNDTDNYFAIAHATQIPALDIPDLQNLAASFGNVFRRVGTNSVAAVLDLFAATLSVAVAAPDSQIRQLVTALVDHSRRSGDLSDRGATLIRVVDWGLTAKFLAGLSFILSPLKFVNTLVGSVLLRLVASAFSSSMSDAQIILQDEFGSTNLVTVGDASSKEDAKAQYDVLMARVDPIRESLLNDALIDPEELARTLTSGPNWRENLFSYAELATAKTGAELAALFIDIGNVLQTSAVASGDTTYKNNMTTFIDTQVVEWSERIANGNAKLLATYAGIDVGGFATADFSEYNRIVNVFRAAMSNRANQSIKAALADGLDIIEKAGEKVFIAIRPGPQAISAFESNTPQDAGTLHEGSAKTLVANLPFAAGDGGQRIRFKLEGGPADSFEVVTGSETIELDASGQFEIDVAEGQHSAAFSLHQKDDVDSDASFTLSATLIDHEGMPTHEEQVVADFELDAVIEPIDPVIDAITIINGTIAPDTLTGTSGSDELLGAGGNDILSAGAGNDLVDGGEGDDVANGDAGDDKMLGGLGDDRFSGDDGNDLILGGTGRDILSGADGVDQLFVNDEVTVSDAIASGNTDAGSSLKGEWESGGAGDDVLVAGADDDLIWGGGNDDLIIAEAGNDVIFGDSDAVLFSPDWSVTREIVGSGPGAVKTVTITDIFSALGAAGEDTIYAGNGDDIVFAELGDDFVDGGAGSDQISGGAGSDTILGGEGDDNLIGDDKLTLVPAALQGDDFIDGGAGNDNISGDGGNDTLYGGSGDDRIEGDSLDVIGGDDYIDGEGGNDALIGVGGADTIYGGTGDDVIDGDSGDTPEAQQGDDELFGEDGNDNISGDGGRDTIDGGAGDDSLFGGEGDDTIFGGDGNDYLQGDEGNDTLDGGDGIDAIHGNDGDDTIFGGAGDDRSSLGGGLTGEAGNDFIDGEGGDDELQGGDGNDQLLGSDGNDLLFGQAGDDALEGGSGNDELQGGDGNDGLSGGGGNDVLFGQDGDDTLSGGPGNDFLSGGAGKDTYIFNAGDGIETIEDDSTGLDASILQFGAGITVDDLALGLGSLLIKVGTAGDAIDIKSFDASDPYSHPAFAAFEFADGTSLSWETLLTGGFNIAASSANDNLFGANGADTIDGGSGNDTIHARDGDDTLIGGKGDDILFGEGGNDTYLLKSGDGNDQITDDAGDNDRIVFGAGISADQLIVTKLPMPGTSLKVAYGASDSIVVSDRSQIETYQFVDGTTLSADDIFARALIEIQGTPGNDTLTGTSDADLLEGLGGNDVLNGLDGNDRLDGGSGADTMRGGPGDETYIVDNFSDTVVENASEGHDTVQASIAFTLPTNVEDLILTGTATLGTGNSDNNHIVGNANSNMLNGGAGDDVLEGKDGNDTLDGGSGIDTMVGGRGNDSYTVDNVADVIIELPGEGIDRVVASSDYALPPEIENLTLTGTARVGIGNALDNTISDNASDNVLSGDGGNDQIIGGTGNDVLDGGLGNDLLFDTQGINVLLGGDGDDQLTGVGTLRGGDGNDSLEGFASVGSNILDGGRGNDTIFVHSSSTGVSAGDTIIFGNGYGKDTVVESDHGNVVQMLPGIVPSDVTVTTKIGSQGLNSTSGTLILSLNGGADQLQLLNWYGERELQPRVTTPSYSIREVRFDDGTVWNQQILTQKWVAAQQATSGADTLMGLSRDDRLDGGAGDDLIFGNSGDDIISAGDGQDVIDGGSGDDYLMGGDGNDSIRGGQGDDVIDGGPGDDVLTGDAGNNTYLIKRGGGRDTITSLANNLGANLPNDTILFAPDILSGDAVLLRNSQDPTHLDLRIRIRDSSDEVTINGWYSDNGRAIARLQFADGTVWDANAVASRVQEGVLLADGQLHGTPADDSLTASDLAGAVFGYAGNDVLTGDSAGNSLLGGDGNDVLFGGAGGDSLVGGDGDDVIAAGAGDDFSVDGGNGDDVLDGETGNDSLDGGDGNDVLSGGVGDDVLVGGNGDDVLDGGLGNDSLASGAGSNTILFGLKSGQDTIDLSENLRIRIDLSGNVRVATLNTVKLGAGIAPEDLEVSQLDLDRTLIAVRGTEDSLTFIDALAADQNNLRIDFEDGTTWDLDYLRSRVGPLFNLDSGQVSLFGSSGDDALAAVGTAEIRGNAGNDVINGGSGGDALFGGSGDDVISGGDGFDVITGDDGNDILNGDAGNDNLSGGAGDDSLDGGPDDDVLAGGSGGDVYWFGFGSGHDTIQNAISADEALLGNGTIRFKAGVTPANVATTFDANIFGAADFLRFTLAGGSDSLAVAVTGLYKAGMPRHAVFDDGTVLDLVDLAKNKLDGTAGNDTITAVFSPGRNRDAVIRGFGGNDTLNGVSGDDVLIGGAGNDTLNGQLGNDTYVYEPGFGKDSIDEPSGGENVISFGAGISTEDISFSGIVGPFGTTDLKIALVNEADVITWHGLGEFGTLGLDRIQFADGSVLKPADIAERFSSIGTASNDFMLGSDKNDVRSGLGGDDFIYGEEDNDTLSGGDGQDHVFGGNGDDVLDGGNDNDGLDGGAGNDILTGGAGADRLIGGIGDDILVGGPGADQLFGGMGDDIYRFERGFGQDIVYEGQWGGVNGGFLGQIIAGGNDAIEFGAGIAPQDIVVTADRFDINRFQDPSLNLYLAVKGSSDQLTLQAWFNHDSFGGSSVEKDILGGAVEQVRFSDGTVWYVDNLMAKTFQPSADMDVFYGSTANDIINGADGDDSLYGQEGNDILDGAKGNDKLYGGVGNDIYLFNRGSGQDAILDFDPGAGNFDKIVLGDGIAPSDLSISRNDSDIVIKINGTLDQLSIRWFPDPGYAVERVEFSDHSYWDASTLEQLANGAGTGILHTVASPIADATVRTDTAFDLQVPTTVFFNALDPSHDYTYAASLSDGSALPAWLSFDDASLKFSGAPGSADIGALDIKVTGAEKVAGADIGTYIVSEVFKLKVTSEIVTNQPPQLVSPIADQPATEDAVFSFTLPPNTFADVDFGDVLTYGATRANGDALPSWLAFNPATRTFSGTPANSDVGILSVKVAATDVADAAVFDSFDISVANTNDAPTLATVLADQNAAAGGAFNFTIPANTFADVDAGDALTLAVARSNGAALPAWLAYDSATRAFSGTPSLADAGTVSIKITATDAAGASAFDIFDLTVTGANQPPIAALSIADRTTIEDTAFSFTVPADTFTDPDVADVLIYRATRADGSALPTWLAFDPATRAFSGIPGNNDVGSIDIQITATDAANTSAATVFAIAVANVNDAPSLSHPTPDQLATVGAPFVLHLQDDTFSDVDVGDILTYSANLVDGRALPIWLAFDAATQRFTGTPTSDDAGAYAVKVTATDSGSLSVAETFDLSVSLPAGSTLIGTPDNDVLSGGAADDTLDGREASDLLLGNGGNDTLRYFADDIWHGGFYAYNAGSPGNPGTGHIASITGKNRSFDVFDGGAGFDVVVGTAEDDVLALDDGFSPFPGGSRVPRLKEIEIIEGRAGNDVIDLTSWDYDYGDVTLDGGDCNDVLWASSGNDVLIGGAGDDELSGGAGNDYLTGGPGNDVLDGGSGNDVLEGGTDSDTLTDTSGNNIFNAGADGDSLAGGSGNEIFIGGAGNDAITTGGGADIVTFNRGDGNDIVAASTATDNTVSIGGGIQYADLTLSKSGDNLVLETGASESLTLQDWYVGTGNKSVSNFQMIAEAMSDYAPGGSDPLRDNKVERYDFQAIVNAFDLAGATNAWSVMNALLDAHLAGSDTEALGGDFAYRYGLTGSLAGLALSPAQGILSGAQFGSAPQTLQPLAGLQEGLVKLG